MENPSTHHLLGTLDNLSLIHTSPQYSFSILIFTGKEMSLERLSNLPKVTKILSRITIQTQVYFPKKLIALNTLVFRIYTHSPSLRKLLNPLHPYKE